MIKIFYWFIPMIYRHIVWWFLHIADVFTVSSMSMFHQGNISIIHSFLKLLRYVQCRFSCIYSCSNFGITIWFPWKIIPDWRLKLIFPYSLESSRFIFDSSGFIYWLIEVLELWLRSHRWFYYTNHFFLCREFFPCHFLLFYSLQSLTS